MSDETNEPQETEVDPTAGETTGEVAGAGEAAAEQDQVDGQQAEVEEAAAESDSPADGSEPAGEAESPEPEAEADAAKPAKPEIPGADLVPDIVPEGETAIAEAEGDEGGYGGEGEGEDDGDAEAAAEEASEEDVVEQQPIAGAAIDLAKNARYEATGKRKSAIARVTLKPGKGEYSLNGRTLEDVFPRVTLQRNVRQPLEAVGYEDRMDVVALLHGGGVSAQADALRHGISRALVKADPNLRGELKRRGFLTRDPRVVERKKAGLKKARKRPQFSKR